MCPVPCFGRIDPSLREAGVHAGIVLVVDRLHLAECWQLAHLFGVTFCEPLSLLFRVAQTLDELGPDRLHLLDHLGDVDPLNHDPPYKKFSKNLFSEPKRDL